MPKIGLCELVRLVSNNYDGARRVLAPQHRRLIIWNERRAEFESEVLQLLVSEGLIWDDYYPVTIEQILDLEYLSCSYASGYIGFVDCNAYTIMVF